MPLGNWEGAEGDEPEPGDLPVMYQHTFGREECGNSFLMSKSSLL